MAKINRGATNACPANCFGGNAEYQRSLYTVERECIPTEILETAKSDLRFCKYCNAVWEDREGGKKLHGYLENGRFHRNKMISG